MTVPDLVRIYECRISDICCTYIHSALGHPIYLLKLGLHKPSSLKTLTLVKIALIDLETLKSILLCSMLHVRMTLMSVLIIQNENVSESNVFI